MRKSLCCLLIFVLIFAALAGCKGHETPLPSNTTNTEEIPTTTENNESDHVQEILDERITTTETQKTFNDSWITLSVPATWKCFESRGGDGSAIFFRDPTLNEECEISLYITGAVYANERTKDEYLEYFSNLGYEDVTIDALTKETVNGYPCTKVVTSYTSESTKHIQINYDNLVVGLRLYKFTITYPALEGKTVETVFETVMDSIQFLKTE